MGGGQPQGADQGEAETGQRGVQRPAWDRERRQAGPGTDPGLQLGAHRVHCDGAAPGLRRSIPAGAQRQHLPVDLRDPRPVEGGMDDSEPLKAALDFSGLLIRAQEGVEAAHQDVKIIG